MELGNCCPTCLDSWDSAAYPCTLQQAESKPKCPLCKTKNLCIVCRWTMTLRNMLSLHLQCHQLLGTRQEDLMAIQLPTDLE